MVKGIREVDTLVEDYPFDDEPLVDSNNINEPIQHVHTNKAPEALESTLEANRKAS